MLTVLHEGMLKAWREGRSEAEWRGAGGIGGRPGVLMCAVLDGSRVGRLPPLPAGVGPDGGCDVLLLLLLLWFVAGGVYGGMVSPVETVVW